MRNKCQICYDPCEDQFCADCWKKIEKKFEKYKYAAYGRAIREVTLEVRRTKNQEELAL